MKARSGKPHFTRTAGIGLAAFCAAFLAGCGDSEIKTYRVAKDDSAPPRVPPAPAAPFAGGGAPERPSAPLPHLHWALPQGWTELQPDGMRVASFLVGGEGGKSAQVAIIPLPGASGIETESVNMWRQELQLPDLSAAEVKDLAQPAAVGDVGGKLYELASAPGEGGAVKTRTLGVMAERKGVLWFVKLTGDDALVAQQKSAFTGFLKSIDFHDGAHGSPAPAAVASQQPERTASQAVDPGTPKADAAAGGELGKVPENWVSKAPGPMVMTAYNVPGDGGAQAEVTISKFPGDVGGMMPNINRWRSQLGLAPEGDPSKIERPEIGGKKDAYLIDIQGTNSRTGKAARMIAAGVPRGGETWFYKLMGDEAVVAKEKAAFVRFLSAP